MNNGAAIWKQKNKQEPGRPTKEETINNPPPRRGGFNEHPTATKATGYYGSVRCDICGALASCQAAIERHKQYRHRQRHNDNSTPLVPSKSGVKGGKNEGC